MDNNIHIFDKPIHLFSIADEGEYATLEFIDQLGNQVKTSAPFFLLGKADENGNFPAHTVGGGLIANIAACQESAKSIFDNGFITFVIERGEEFGICAVDARWTLQKISTHKNKQETTVLSVSVSSK